MLQKVSVIVPCYNSAKYLEDSLQCLLSQHDANLEIICVNDGSTDETGQILQRYENDHQNIRIVDLKENQGLFHARLAGAERATGDYIAFMDSDDKVTRHWFGALVRKAEESKADLVFGDMRKNGKVPNDGIDPKIDCYYNLDPLKGVDLDTDGAGIMQLFMQAHGLCSHYHYIWNKLIRRDLWQRCVAEYTPFSDRQGHLVMGEDIAFSAVLFVFARHVVNIHHEYYIYCVHDDQSVNTNSIKKFRKNIDDLSAVFDFIQTVLEKYDLFEKYSGQYLLLKQRYGMIYTRLARGMCLPNEVVEDVSRRFAQDRIQDIKEIKTEQFLRQMTNVSPIDGVYRGLIDQIYSPEIKVISFDVFDTLVVRPFARPMDIFNYLNKPFSKIFGIDTFIDFAQIRNQAEEQCHKKQKVLRPGIEEPTMDEIYDEISLSYGYDRDKLRILQEIEIENEIRYAYPRKAGIALYREAQNAGKHIIVASDMYLPRACIEKILRKCGVSGYEKLYLSCELHLTKHSGKMYHVIKKEYGSVARPEQILHIGDNYNSDVTRAKESGLRAQHFPAPIGLLQGRNPGIYTGKSFEKIFYVSDRYTDMDLAYYGFSGLRSALAVVANHIFDFPYVSFNRSSDLNEDPAFVGYYIVGMHIFSLARWLIGKTKGKGYRKIHFAARDGYLVKRAYDILTQGMQDVPESGYIRVSRKSFAIADITQREDIHSLSQKLNYASQCPNSIYELFEPVMSARSKKLYAEERAKNAALCEVRFIDRIQFADYLTKFYDKYLHDADFDGYRLRLREYFGGIISPRDVFFDIGYSCRVELALHRLLGFPIKSYYVHSNNDAKNKREELGDIENEMFYQYKPIVTGVIREHIISELAPSTIGYRWKDGGVEPVFDRFEMTYPTYFITNRIQEEALQFVQDMYSIFGSEALTLYARDHELSRPFEYYLHFSRSIDRNLFADLEFEDDFGEGHSVSGIEFWNRCLQRIHCDHPVAAPKEPEYPAAVQKKSRFWHALYLFLFDRKRFFKKLKKGQR